MPGEDASRELSPTISIYQNPDHVVGILQQLFDAPVVTNQTLESLHSDKSSDSAESRGQISGGAAGSIPMVASGGIDAGYDRLNAGGKDLVLESKRTHNFEYSQSYYLYKVRDALLGRGALKELWCAGDVQDVQSGDFVEYKASFRPSEVHALLDVLAPDVVSAWVRNRYMAKKLGPDFPEPGTIDDYKAYYEKAGAQADLQAEAAGLVARSVQVDFRTQKTREFYGNIDDATAVTICDNEHFVVSDEDRILDGEFRVLGKATSGAEKDRPILSRNKVLERLNPVVVDEILEQMQDALADQAPSRIGKIDISPSDMVDLRLSSRIDGTSIQVIPIAIYT